MEWIKVFEQDLRSRNFLDIVKTNKQFFSTKKGGKVVTFRIKICDSAAYKCDARYSVTETGFSENKADFWVFCFCKDEAPYMVFMPYNVLANFFEKNGFGSGRFNFSFELDSDGLLNAFIKGNESKKEDCSVYLNDNGWVQVADF